eukprot:scaffold105105_cov62-Attheya_sp.AAC.1
MLPPPWTLLSLHRPLLALPMHSPLPFYLGDGVQQALVPVFLRTLPERIIGASLDVWSMYPSKMQINAIAAIVDIDVSHGKVLLLAKTGSGKSHVMYTVDIMLGWVSLIMMPLLALGSDQVAKLHAVSQEFGTVDSSMLTSTSKFLWNLIKLYTESAPFRLMTTLPSSFFVLYSPRPYRIDPRFNKLY